MSDRRWQVLLFVMVAAAAGGVLVYVLPERAKVLEAPTAVPEESAEPRSTTPAYAGELHERFQQAAIMLHAGRHLYALEALERVIELAPWLPEARVNAGYALLGLARPGRAREQFETAIDLRPGQANAYYGLAVALEALGDLEGALGAMRSYVHLAEQGGRHVRLARSAIWEWQALLGREFGDHDAAGPVTKPAERG